MIGKRLGPFQVVDLLGKGGMGEVYRARDAKLDRDVAIKVLPREMSGDPERVARFQREARSLAALQHPNVASVYGFEETPEARFLVMELVEGEELAARLERGPIPPAETERIARQIATGLAAAHDEGLVHRDLKPANIKLTPDGEVKILDFGLARAYAGDGPEGGDLANSPTITAAMTQAGAIMGTASYMSPEQARGQTADRRADVWAFGCVVYECLTGQQAYPGETVTDVIASIIHREPDWAVLPASTPASLRKVLELCLEKSRNERLRDMGDVGLLLDHLEAVPGTARGETRTSRAAWAWVALALVAGVALGAIALGGRGAGETGTPRHRITRLTDLPGVQRAHSLSPDGNQLVYTSQGPEGQDVFLQRVSGTNPINLTADNPGLDTQPSFSPNGQRIAFASDRGEGGIFVMGATGETPLRVTDFGYDPEWSPDGTEIAFVDEYVINPLTRFGLSKLRVVNLDSREVRVVGDMDAMYPAWSPSGRRIAFATYLGSVQGQRDLWSVDVATGETTPLLEGPAACWSPVWSSDGQWLYYVSDESGTTDIWRVAIDEATGATRGKPEPITSGAASVFEISRSGQGRLAFSSRSNRSRVWVADFDATRLQLTSEPELVVDSSLRVAQVDISADGNTIAYHSGGKPEQITIHSLSDGSSRRIIVDQHRNRGPRLSSDGRWLLYYSNRNGSYEIWAIRTDGTGNRALTEIDSIDLNQPHFVGDDRIYFSAGATGNLVGFIRLPEGGIDAIAEPIPLEWVDGSNDVFDFRSSPEGTRILGIKFQNLASSTVEIWTLSQGGEALIEEEGSLRIPFNGLATWLDEDRLIAWDVDEESCVVFDARDGSTTHVDGVPGPSRIEVSRTPRRLVVSAIELSGDLWLLELEED